MLFRVRCTALHLTGEVFLVRAESADAAREKVRARTTYHAEEAEPVEFDEDGVLRVYDGD
jgi:hypothetical protein